jgi:hypothetical protein
MASWASTEPVASRDRCSMHDTVVELFNGTKIPWTAQQAAVRTLYDVFEAFFTFAFWAMRENDFGNDWGMGEMCL